MYLQPAGYGLKMCTDFILCCYFSQELAEVLDSFGQKWELNPGDGAFYGPKVSGCVGHNWEVSSTLVTTVWTVAEVSPSWWCWDIIANNYVFL